MNRNILIGLIFLLIAVNAVFHHKIKKRPTENDIKRVTSQITKPSRWTGKTAKDFKLTLTDGSEFQLSDHIGKDLIILNFFATWCEPCVAEIPEFNRFYKENKDRPFVMIGIDAGEDLSLVRAFIIKNKVEYPVGVDNKDVRELYGVDAYPTTIVINSRGKIIVYSMGAIDNTDVVFSPLLVSHESQLKQNKIISKEDFLKKQKKNNVPALELFSGEQRIQNKIKCYCDCGKLVINCKCQTAQEIKSRIKLLRKSNLPDSEIIRFISRQNCKEDEQQ